MNTQILMPRLEDLRNKTQRLYEDLEDNEQKFRAYYALACLSALQRALEKQEPIFGFEPWHNLYEPGNFSSPAEMLLRLKDLRGNALPPYPSIMAFYDNDLAAEIDTILFLYALWQFVESGQQQVSINVSARSMHSGDFIKTVLSAMEKLRLDKAGYDRIIIEIHESAPNLVMSKHILNMFRKFGASFAIDDVGLSLGDVFRFAEFDSIASYVKIDRKTVSTASESPNGLPYVLSFVKSIFPDAIIIAEGVQSVLHALEIHETYPDIAYVQGMYLPSRQEFARSWSDFKMTKLRHGAL